MSIKLKLRQYADFKGISHRKFSFSLGKSDKFIASEGSINSDVFPILRNNFPDLNMQWVLFDEGEMIKRADFKVNEPRDLYVNPGKSIESQIKDIARIEVGGLEKFTKEGLASLQDQILILFRRDIEEMKELEKQLNKKTN